MFSSTLLLVLYFLPIVGVNTNAVTELRYAARLRDAEFNVTVIPNQGSGAAAMRIEAVRRLFPKLWFNESTTEAGRDALGCYHECKDERRDIGLGSGARLKFTRRAACSPNITRARYVTSPPLPGLALS